MLTVFLVLVIAAFICTIMAAMNKCPLWIAVLLICLIELLRALPVGH